MMELKPLPNFEFIKVENIPICSSLIYYGNMPLTSFYGNKRFKHPYKPAAYHAARYLENGLALQVGKFRTLQKLSEDFTEKRRIDVISYNFIPENVKKQMITKAYLDADEPKWGYNRLRYGIFDFLRFEPLLRWLPKSKQPICSEDTYNWFRDYGYVVGNRPNPKLEVAPWDLFAWAMENRDKVLIQTVWVGETFKKKFPS